MLLLRKNAVLNEYRKQPCSGVQPESQQQPENKAGHEAAVSQRDPNALLQGSHSDENIDLGAFYSIGQSSPYSGTITRVFAKKSSKKSAISIISDIKNMTKLPSQVLVNEAGVRKSSPDEIHPESNSPKCGKAHLIEIKGNSHDSDSYAPTEGNNTFVDPYNYSPLSPSSGVGRSTSRSVQSNNMSLAREHNGIGNTPDAALRVLMSPSTVEVETPIHNDYVDLHQTHQGTGLRSESNMEGRTSPRTVSDTPLAAATNCIENNTLLTFNVSATSSFDEDFSGLSFTKRQYKSSLIAGSGGGNRWHDNDGNNNDGMLYEGKLPMGLLVPSKRHSTTESALMEPLASSRVESSAISISSYDMPPLRPSSSEFMRYYDLDRKSYNGRSVMVASAAAMAMVKNGHTLFKNGKSKELFPSTKPGASADIPVQIVYFHRESASSGNMDYDVDTIVVSPFNTSDISSPYMATENQNRILDSKNKKILRTLENKEMIIAISFVEAAKLLNANVKVDHEPLALKKLNSFFSCFCLDENQNGNVLDHKKKQNNAVEVTARPVLTTTSWKEGLKIVTRLKSTSYNPGDVVHKRILLTIYYVLIDTESGRPRDQIVSIRNSSLAKQVGVEQPALPLYDSSLWEAIGFQGSNPSTDLRDTGMVGLLQLLYMFSSYAGLTQTLWHLCQSPTPPSPSESLFSLASTPQIEAGSQMLSRDLPFVLIVLTFVGLSLDALQKKKLLMSFATSSPILGNRIKAVTSNGTPLPESFEGPANSKKPSMFHISPALCAVCEYCIGCLQLFCESWQELIKKQYPNRPTVADFGSQKSLLQDRLMKGRGTDLVKKAIKRARQYS